MRTYTDSKCMLHLVYRDPAKESGVFYAAEWRDNLGNYHTDLLCEACRIEHAETYSDASVRSTVLASDEACHLCGSPEVDRVATLQELCNIFS